jgi:hypothetical protein
MEQRQFGRTGMQVSILGFGGAEIGFSDTDITLVERVLDSALDAGLNVIDTAECYKTSEELIGKAVSYRRRDYYLFTKCGHSSGFDLPDWNPQMLKDSIDRSLIRLNTDYVDLVCLHSCDIDTLKQGDAIAVLQEARDAGKTRFIGYSGDGAAARYAIETDVFDALETSVNIADQEAITLTLPLAVKHNMGVIAKRPVANAVWRSSRREEVSDYNMTYWDRLQKLDYPFLRNENAGDVVATSLRFTLTALGVHVAIVGTTNPDRYRQNAGAVNSGILPISQFNAIRNRWNVVAQPDWVGQT